MDTSTRPAPAPPGVRGAPRAVRGLGVASALVLALSLAGCGEYSPVTTDSDDTTDQSQSDSGTPGGDRDDPPAEADEDSGDTSPPAGDGDPPPDAGPGDQPRGQDSPRTVAAPPRSPVTPVGNPPAPGGPPPKPPKPPEPEPPRYTWAPPPTDTSPQFEDGPAYALLSGTDQCAAAQQHLDDNPDGTPNAPNRPYGFSNPRYAVFYWAGIALCQQDAVAAQARYTHAVERYGLAGIDRASHPLDENFVPLPPPRKRGYGEPECDLYRTLTALLTNVHVDSVDCRGGLGPVFTFSTYQTDAGEVVVFDDPLTFGTDESTVTPVGWDQQPGVPGATDPLGDVEYGDPEDEFGFENSGGVPAPAAFAAAAETATEDVGAEEEPPVAASDPPAEPAAAEADPPDSTEPAEPETIDPAE